MAAEQKTDETVTVKPAAPRCWGLFRRRECLVPTWRGWLALMLVCVALAIIAVREVSPFLNVTAPAPGGVLVVEGWMADYGLEATVTEFRRNHYDKVYVVGGPLDLGSPLIEYKTLAELSAATLLKLGLSTNEVQAVPAAWVRQDRTYTAAVTLKKWWRDHGLAPTIVNLMSGGPHARRSRLLFEKALGPGVKVGVISVPDRNYDPQHWWRSSPGFRIITGEALAYGYARVLFRAKDE
jgi:hypothetical protein